MTYCTYEDYAGDLSEEEFEKYAARASRLIDRLTCGRAKAYPEAPGLSDACAEIADLFGSTAAVPSVPGLRSVRNDGYEEEYYESGSSVLTDLAEAILRRNLGADAEGLLLRWVI